MPEAESTQASAPALLDAGMFIGALLVEDSRHTEARPLVEQARQGVLRACTTASILSEVYGALTWEQAEPPHNPAEAAEAVRLLVEPPSAIAVLDEHLDALFLALTLAAKHQLRARRIHDARHAAVALSRGITSVYTYDIDDWKYFHADGLHIVGPPTTLARIAQLASRS